MSKKMVFGIAVAILGLAAWYAFRPERPFINQTVNEQFPVASAAGSPVELSSGQFHNGAHETKGTATVYKLANGIRSLRLTNFATSSGPDVHVYLVAAADALDNESVTNAGFIDLGNLKGNIGDQNYSIPAEVGLSKFRAATIWGKRFSVNFGTAPLIAK
jgi:Electron transfer DM13